MQVIVFMIMLTRSSERIFNPMRYAGNKKGPSAKKSSEQIMAKLTKMALLQISNLEIGNFKEDFVLCTSKRKEHFVLNVITLNKIQLFP